MKKILLSFFVLTFVLISCDKEENAAKDVTYIFDEEFLSNDLNWYTAVTLDSNNRKPERREDTANIFEQISVNNGSFKIGSYTSSAKPLAYYLDAKATAVNVNNDFFVESSVSWLAKDKAGVYSGLVWNYLDDNNYCYFGVDYNGSYEFGRYDNGKNTLESSGGVEDVTPSFKLKVSKVGMDVFYLINDQFVDTANTMNLSDDFSVGLYAEKATNASLLYIRVAQ